MSDVASHRAIKLILKPILLDTKILRCGMHGEEQAESL